MFENEQVKLWRGEFGDEYMVRNAPTHERVANQTRFWAQLFNTLAVQNLEPGSILEVGANVGINLRALRNLSDAELFAVEPNDQAREVLIRDGVVTPENALATTGEAIELEDNSVDMAFTAGVLIHVNPETLAQVCAEIHRVSRKTIVCAEYFSANPETISYRGHTEKLFKRDFGAFWMEQFPSLKLLDYGFAWKPVTGLDNITWWIFSKPDA